MSISNLVRFETFRKKIIAAGIVLGLCWFVVLGALLGWELRVQKKTFLDLAAAEATASYNKDLVYRRWASEHGGVYVPLTGKTPSSPYLSHVEEQNIITSSGKSLTLVNPAYMTRQVHELAQLQYGVRGHITSLNPLRPENKPDEWEATALEQLQKGVAEVVEVKSIDGEEYFRLMRPMITEKGCLKCHSAQGYKEGDIRGGISVSVPLDQFSVAAKNNTIVLVFVHVLLFMIGLGGIWLAFAGLAGTGRKLVQAQHLLQESEKQLNTIFHAADNVAFVTTDLGGEDSLVTGFSPGAEKVFGYSSDEIIGKKVEVLHLPGIVKEFPQIQQSLKRGEKGFAGETVLVKKSGEQFHGMFTVHPYSDAAGELVGTIGVTIDITDRKRAEEELRESEETARALLDSTFESSFLIETDGTFVTMNSMTAQRLEKNVEELIGKVLYDFLPNEIADSRKEQIRKVVETGAPVKFIDERKGVFFNHSLWPVFDLEGKVYRVAVFAQDITKERMAEDALKENEKKFKNMFQQAPISYQSLDEEGNFTEVNTTWLETLGYERGEVIGNNFSEFLVPEWKDHFTENFPRFRAVGEVLGIEFEMLKKDGSKILVSFHGKIGVNRDGGFERTHCVFSDVTIQRSAEETLRKDLAFNIAIADISKELLSESYSIKKVSDTVLAAAKQITDSKHGFVSSIDRATGDNIGHTLTEMFGESCRVKDQSVVFPVGSDGRYGALWGNALNTREPFFTNNPKVHPSSAGIPEGHIPIERYMGVPVVMGDMLLGLIALSNSSRDYLEEDIVSVKRIAELYALAIHRQEYEVQRTEMEQDLRQLQKNEAIGVLAGGIAHDFNNILAPIIGYAEILQEDIVKDSSSQKCVDEILSAADRAKELVRQILTFSRQHEQEIKPLKPNLVIREVLKLIKATIPSAIEIEQDIADNCRTIMADPIQIHQVAMNLMTNAYQAMHSSVGTLTINLQNVDITETDPDLNLQAGPYVLLIVQDTGVGMDRVVLEKIFDPYFTTKSKDKGTGLGLSVVYGIVKKYGGEINVESTPGHGAKFLVYLPAIDKKVVAETRSEGSSLMRGDETILLVDDEEKVLELERQILERLGYEVSKVIDSFEALEKIKQSPHRFDLLITDMTMPKMTGDVLTQEVKKMNPNLPVIICTGYSEILTPERARTIGAAGLLMKPVPRTEMAEMVRRVLDSSVFHRG